jgi:lysophospholipase L1-like esterase
VRRLGRYLLMATTALALAACGSPAIGTGTLDASAPATRFYVSIGDSYAAGYRPVAGGTGGTTTDGFAYQVAAHTRATGNPLRLVNFGCSGSTSIEVRYAPSCAPAARGPGAPDYGGLSQAAAATAFLARHRGQIALVTVVVGGDDVKPCVLTANGAIRPDAIACATAAVADLRTNLTAILRQVRTATGPAVPVVGLTYPDVFLGAWVANTPDDRQLATDSVWLFHDLLNPALKTEYSQVGAAFADVTAAAGGYGSLGQTVSDPPYGVIPVPVAQTCALTYACQLADVHPTVAGNRLIAQQVIDTAHLS